MERTVVYLLIRHINLDLEILPTRFYLLKIWMSTQSLVSLFNFQHPVDGCHFHGRIRGIEDSDVMISTCRDHGIMWAVFDFYILLNSCFTLNNEIIYYIHTIFQFLCSFFPHLKSDGRKRILEALLLCNYNYCTDFWLIQIK